MESGLISTFATFEVSCFIRLDSMCHKNSITYLAVEPPYFQHN